MEVIGYFVRMMFPRVYNTLESFYRSLTVRRIRHFSDDNLTSVDHNSAPPEETEKLLPVGKIERTWVDNLPFEIPFGFATTFKSDEDWLDDWDEMEEKPKKPYTFDDRVNDYRKGIKKALEITEKKEEKIEEVDLLFAEVVNESEGKDINTDDFFNQRFTPMCTPTKNRKELLDCEEGEWDPEWDEETNDDHPNIKKEHTLMYV